MEGANIFMGYHPLEQTDAEATKDYISKVAPRSKVELGPQDLATEAGCLETVEKVRAWSKGTVHVLLVPSLLRMRIWQTEDLE